MLTLTRVSIRRSGAALLTALALSALGGVQQAAAEGLFDALFGSFQRRLPHQSNSYADPYISPDGERSGSDTSGGYGHGTAFCVPTCDGR